MSDPTCPADESVDPCAVCGACLDVDACQIDTVKGWQHRAEKHQNEVDRLRGLLARALPWIDPNDSHEDYLLTVEIREALGEGT